MPRATEKSSPFTHTLTRNAVSDERRNTTGRSTIRGPGEIFDRLFLSSYGAQSISYFYQRGKRQCGTAISSGDTISTPSNLSPLLLPRQYYTTELSQCGIQLLSKISHFAIQ